MPANRDRRHAEQRRDRSDGTPLDFSHHDHGPAARGQGIERRPYHVANDEGLFRVAGLHDTVEDGSVASSNRLLPPLIVSNVDEHADEPGLLVFEAMGNRLGPSRLEKGLLNEVERIVRARDEASRDAIEAVHVGLEQR